ncbi:GNAT family N-acetyltransferase [Nocardioides sp. SYSU DS0651]|uniref:GNAT family N-acetyltransferase n=1 Tax=Nocardioides sp. SYSU DS0651 TaxID=3415955 RepID=UPI003F4B9439
MTLTTRQLGADDLGAMMTLSAEAFGAQPPGTPLPTWPRPGRSCWGTFDGDQLVAQVVGRAFHSWWRGREVPTNGIAAVAVRTEHRGAGLLADLFREVLAQGRAERAEVISTLFPTAPGIYRGLGYELVGALDTVEVPTAALAAVRPAEGLAVRRAQPSDMAAIRAVYDAWAAAQDGPLTRRGPSFPETDEEIVGEFSGISLAVTDEGRVVGYCSWERGTGYDETRSAIEVTDLLAVEPGAVPTLWRMLGTFSSVAGRVRLQTSGADLARTFLPTLAWKVVDSHPYMLRVDDVAGAVSAVTRSDAPCAFSVAGDRLGVMDGDYTVDEAGRCAAVAPSETGSPGERPTYHPRGLALAWSGTQGSAALRLAGLLTGPATYDDALDATFAGRPLHIRDYF